MRQRASARTPERGVPHKGGNLKTRLLALAVALGVLAGFGVAAGACTSSDGAALTLEEYFQLLDELDNRSDDQFGELDSRLGDDPDIWLHDYPWVYGNAIRVQP